MNFHSLYDQGFARVAAVTLPVHPARPFENAREIIDTRTTIIYRTAKKLPSLS